MTRKFLITVAIVAIALTASMGIGTAQARGFGGGFGGGGFHGGGFGGRGFGGRGFGGGGFGRRGFFTGVFSAGTVVSLRTTMDTVMPRTVTTRSTVRPPATDRILLATWNRTALAQTQKPRSSGGALAT